MNNLRIKALADDVDIDDVVLDVGCDHGYLSIYLKKNNLCKEVYASDISVNALNVARENFRKNKLDIKTFVSDGFENIPVKFDTAVIAGMGTSTILKILKNKKRPNRLILGSQNDLYHLRSAMYNLGYKLVDEQAILEKGHYYIILLYVKMEQKLSKINLKFGISNNNDYYSYLIKKNKEIIKKVPFKKKMELIYDNLILTWLIRRK